MNEYDDNEITKELTPMQIAFAEAYMRSGNARKSALEAGYSDDTATAQGSRLARHVGICMYMKEIRRKAESEAIADARQIQMMLTAIAKGEILDPIVDAHGDEHMLASHSRERVKALEVLARVQGLMTDNMHLSLDSKVQFVDEWGADAKPGKGKQPKQIEKPVIE